MPGVWGGGAEPPVLLLPASLLQVMAIVAAFVAYVAALDWVCGNLPRLIVYENAHPGWLRRLVGGWIAAAAQRLTGG